MSRDRWDVVREAALARLKCADPWTQLVAWACRSVSPDQELTVPVLTAALRSLGDAQRTDYSSLDGRLHLRPTGSAVRQHLILGAARHILTSSPEPEALRVLNGLIGDSEALSVSTIGELEVMFKRVGLELASLLGEKWSRSMAWMMPTRDDLHQKHIDFLELVDDPSVVSDDDECDDVGRSLELGALLTATSFWEMSLSEIRDMSASEPQSAARRMVIHAVVRAAGLDHTRLVRQARAMKKQILGCDVGEERALFALFVLPKVDAEADFDQPLFGVERMPELEELILGECQFFAFNAAHVLYGLREQFEYLHVIESLLSRGQGGTLHICAALACALPNGAGQQLLLDRLCRSDSTSGCRYLYQHLLPPYGPRHLDAVRKGLEGTSAPAATAAAELASKLPVNAALADEWRIYFDQWKVKEEPYPKKGGSVPDSPREELAKILVQAFAHDHAFLLELLADDRPDVRAAAREPVLTAAAASQPLRMRLLEDVQSGSLEPVILREAVSRGLYLGEEAMLVARLLHSSAARVRYAALPILEAKFLPLGLVQDEGTRLLTDVEMDIREEASRAMQGLELPKA